jgi:hypothetical protein
MVKVRRRTMLGMALGIALISAGSTCGQPTRNTAASMNRYKIALDEFQKRELQAAVTDSKKALEYDPDNADALNLLGLIAAQRGVDDIDLAEKRAASVARSGSLGRPTAASPRPRSPARHQGARDHAEAYSPARGVVAQVAMTRLAPGGAGVCAPADAGLKCAPTWARPTTTSAIM